MSKYGSLVFVFTKQRQFTEKCQVMNLLDRSYIQDKRHGRQYDIKLIKDDIIFYNMFQSSITSRGFQNLNLISYDRPDVLEHYVQSGSFFVAKVVNPMIKKFVVLNSRKYRIIYLGPDVEKGKSRFRLASAFVYDNDREETMLAWGETTKINNDDVFV